MGLDKIHIDGLIHPRFLLSFFTLYQRSQAQERNKIGEAGIGFLL